ncbi:MAG: hypothetical protein AMDU1_APLC00014G0024 [Thermoplasmatales archaeon A-plasma]|nr:MAG: hypothetical protein AMDU1_APLC00014G0024 [Thermoplasmatales archaeon A-plasma]
MDDISRTEEFNREAIAYSEYYKGKIQVLPKVPVRGPAGFFLLVHTRGGCSLPEDSQGSRQFFRTDRKMEFGGNTHGWFEGSGAWKRGARRLQCR